MEPHIATSMSLALINEVLPDHAQLNSLIVTDLMNFSESSRMMNQSTTERMTAALHVLLECLPEELTTRIDRYCIDELIATLDLRIGEQLDDILHDRNFQACESLWRGLQNLVKEADAEQNAYVEILDLDRSTIEEDFADSPEIRHSLLYRHIYIEEYDTPGGEPFTSLIIPDEMTAQTPDIHYLKNLSQVAMAAHCPVLANVGPEFFQRQTFADVVQIDDFDTFFQRAEYIEWSALRRHPASRYLGLCLPRQLARYPYGKQNPVRSFVYNEIVDVDHSGQYLWTPSVFAFAANMMTSFKEQGWCVNIRGPESGGKVHDLVLPLFDLGSGLQQKIPTEVLISESVEVALSQAGFIPLSYYKNSQYACFFSANSIQQVELYQNDAANANSRINARLPYVLLSARLAHYLKVLQRETIGANKQPAELEQELNSWLQSLVTKMNNPSPELAATHPLREGYVHVKAQADQPGYFQVELFALPHFQIEGMDVTLSLVTQLPGKKSETDF